MEINEIYRIAKMTLGDTNQLSLTAKTTVSENRLLINQTEIQINQKVHTK